MNNQCLSVPWRASWKIEAILHADQVFQLFRTFPFFPAQGATQSPKLGAERLTGTGRREEVAPIVPRAVEKRRQTPIVEIRKGR